MSKFTRTVWLASHGFEIHTISFLVGLSAKLTEHDWNLYTEQPMTDHRRRQLQQDLFDQPTHLPEKNSL